MFDANYAAGVAEFFLDRVDTRNALSTELISALDHALDDLRRRPDIQVLILAGRGDHFCAGADIREIAKLDPEKATKSAYTGCSKRLAECEIPVIAAVEGCALGGGSELIEMCDIVVAADNAKFGHPEVLVGTMSGAGGIQRLVRRLGHARAMDVLLTGRVVAAPEALAMGWISRVCQPGKALAIAREIASGITSLPTGSVQGIKRSARAAFEMPLEDALQLEMELFHQTLTTGDVPCRVEKFLNRKLGAQAQTDSARAN
jgi:enoyl-CoA hydratase